MSMRAQQKFVSCNADCDHLHVEEHTQGIIRCSSIMEFIERDTHMDVLAQIRKILYDEIEDVNNLPNARPVE